MTDALLPLAMVLIAAELGAFVAHAVHLPRVVGQIGAGIALGPSLLGVVSDGPQIAMLASVGALAILATAGLETNVEAMRRVGRPAFLAAIGGVVLPLVGGTVVATAFGLDARASIFCGAILTATSVGITAATLQSLGLLGGRAGLTILGAAVIDDVLGLMVLAVVISETTSGASPVAVVGPMLLTIAVAAAAVRYLPSHLHRVVDALHVRGGGLAAVVGFVLLVAWLFERFGGLAGITGAYMAGLALAGSPLAERLKEGLVRGGEALVVPVFFASIGLAADLRTVPAVMPFALALLAVACLGKVLGSGVAAWVGGLDGRDATLVGIGMVGRGEVALVAATLGLQSGAIDAGVYSAVVLLTVVTTILAPVGIVAWQRFAVASVPAMRFGRPIPAALPVRVPVASADER